jgi:hypothetical protein
MKRLNTILLVLLVSATTASGWKPKSFLGAKPAMNYGSSIELASLDIGSGSVEEPLVETISRGGGNKAEEGKATIIGSVFNLVNNVAGAGILTLSAGMATGTGWIPAMLICAFLGTIGGHCFKIIGEACELTGEADFKVREQERHD